MADAPISEELTLLRKRSRRRLVGAVAMVVAALVVLWTVMDGKPQPSLAGQPVAIVSSAPDLSSTVTPAAGSTQATVPAVGASNAPGSAAARGSGLALPTSTRPVFAPAPMPVSANVPQSAQVAERVAQRSNTSISMIKKVPPIAKHAGKGPHALPPAHPLVHEDPARILAGLDGSLAAESAGSKTTHGEHFFVQLGAFADADKAAALQHKAKALGVAVRDERIHTNKGTLSRLRAGPFTNRAAANEVRARLEAGGLSASVVNG